MSFKRLGLDRDKISDVIASFADGVKVNGPSKKGGVVVYGVSVPDEKKAALLHLYFNTDGSTTIHHSVGGNQTLSLRIAERVRDCCSVAETKANHLYINKISEDDFGTIRDYLEEVCGANFEAEKEISHGRQYRVRGRQGDVLYFNRYGNNAFQVQGKPFILFSETIEILSEILTFSDIVKPQLDMLEVDCSIDDITDELRRALPNSYDFLGGKVQAILAPSLALLKIDMKLPDYSHMVFPVLRGLEGYLKLLLGEHDISVGRDGFGVCFCSDPSELRPEASAKIACVSTCQALEKVYNYFRQQRHGLFHVDDAVQMTRTIEDRVEANAIICQSLALIEETYVSIPA